VSFNGRSHADVDANDTGETRIDLRRRGGRLIGIGDDDRGRVRLAAALAVLPGKGLVAQRELQAIIGLFRPAYSSARSSYGWCRWRRSCLAAAKASADVLKARLRVKSRRLERYSTPQTPLRLSLASGLAATRGPHGWPNNPFKFNGLPE